MQNRVYKARWRVHGIQQNGKGLNSRKANTDYNDKREAKKNEDSGTQKIQYIEF